MPGFQVGPLAEPEYPSAAAERAMSDFLAAFVPGFELATYPIQQGDAIFIAPVANYLLQDSFNKGWQAQAGGGQVGAGGPGGALPQQQPGQYVQQ